MSDKPGVLLVILGPTAGGKTAISIKVAQAVGGEILSSDSMLIYRHMNIGTAKPSTEEMNGVRHHLINIVEPDKYFSAAHYGKEATKVILEVLSRGVQPILVGGSGLYIRAVIHGIFEGPSANWELREALEAQVRESGSIHLHEHLARVDPKAASIINPNDLRRIVRALEVYKMTGKPISSFFQTEQIGSKPFRALVFGLTRNREELYHRIDKRVEMMMERGLMREVEKLLTMGYSIRLISMQGFGYKHLADCINGKIALQEAVALVKRDTRRFAKRQLTWFRKMEGVKWINLSTLPGGEESAVSIILEGLRNCKIQH